MGDPSGKYNIPPIPERGRAIRRALWIGLPLILILSVLYLTVRPRPERLDASVYRPLPSGFDEVLVEELGCNAAGPERAYLVYYSVLVTDDPVAASLVQLRRHLEQQGWTLSDDVGAISWGSFSGRRPGPRLVDRHVVVGPATEVTGWDESAYPTSYVSGLITGEHGDVEGLSDEQMDRAIVMKFDLDLDC